MRGRERETERESERDRKRERERVIEKEKARKREKLRERQGGEGGTERKRGYQKDLQTNRLTLRQINM